jgi:hypothetical protein
MTIGSALGGQLTIARETTWAVPATATRGVEITDETIDYKKNTKQADGIRAGGRVSRAIRRVPTTVGAAGDVDMAVPSRGFGLWLESALGGTTPVTPGSATTLGALSVVGAVVVTTGAAVALGDVLTIDSAGATPEVRVVLATPGLTPTVAALTYAHANGATVLVNGGAAAFVQKHTYADGASLKSLTVQKGVTQLGGTVVPYTFNGCKVATLTLSCKADDLVTAKVAVDAQNATTATALATAAYTATSDVFSFISGYLAVDGVICAEVVDFSLVIDNKLKTALNHLSSGGLKAEQIQGDFAPISGSMTVDFYDSVFVSKFFSDATASLVLCFSSGLSEAIAITLPSVKYDDASPNLKGGDTVQYSVDYVALDPGTGVPALGINLVSADSAV